MPLLDPRLQSIGQVSFEFTIIKPFSGVQYDIHSRIETYWKSTQTISGGKTKQAQSTEQQHLVTESSLSGQYVWVPIQVTKDHVAFVCPTWRLPTSLMELFACEVNAPQLEKICDLARSKEQIVKQMREVKSVEDVQRLISTSYVPLSQFLALLGPQYKLHLQIILPTVTEQAYLGISLAADVNTIIDTILSTVFAHADDLKGREGCESPRSIFFSSSNSTLCTALNWKQPNCKSFCVMFCAVLMPMSDPVFLASNLGLDDYPENEGAFGSHLKRSPHGLPVVDSDRRCSSVKEAVKFSKLNNLLGLIIDAEVMVHAPALITTIKESGLVLITHGEVNHRKVNVDTQTVHGVDGIQVDGICNLLHGIDT